MGIGIVKISSLNVFLDIYSVSPIQIIITTVFKCIIFYVK
jgi:hypothetical protein